MPWVLLKIKVESCEDLGEDMGNKKKAERMEKLKNDYKKARRALEKIMKDCGLSEKIDMSQFYEIDIDSMLDNQLFDLVNDMKSFASALLEEYFLEPWVEAIKKGYEPDKQPEMINVVKLMIQRDPLNVYDIYSEFFSFLNGLNSDDRRVRKQTLSKIQESASEMTSEDLINKLFELTKTKYSEEVMLALVDGASRCGKNFPHYVEACLGIPIQRGE